MLATMSVGDPLLSKSVHSLDHPEHPLFANYFPCAGLWKDVKARGKVYGSDFVDGLNAQSATTILYMFFVCFAPAVTFGAVMDDLTDGQIGAIEMLVATVIGGLPFHFAAGQPLIIVGGIGPFLVFTQILYDLTLTLEIDFLPVYAWTGYWMGLFCILLGIFGSSSLVRHFTRFTEDTFAALVSWIFILEAAEALINVYINYPIGGAPEAANVALMSTLLCFATYGGIILLRAVGKSRFLSGPVREKISQFAAPVAIVVMVAVDILIDNVTSPKLNIPEAFEPSTKRSWMVDSSALPPWAVFATILPALFGTILVFLSQVITAIIINKPDNHLEKRPGYHLDMFITGVLIIPCSMLGVPWICAATVRAIAHTQSLSVYDNEGKVVRVYEQRLTGVIIHVLIAVATLFFRPILAEVPVAVLYGVFLFMGVTSLNGNKFWDRCSDMFAGVDTWPKELHEIRPNKVRLFTAIQFVCMTILYCLKFTPFAIIFPLLVALLLPLRWSLACIFTQHEFEVLDSKPSPESEDGPKETHPENFSSMHYFSKK